MSGPPQFPLKLSWLEMFSPEEIRRWALEGKKPERLQNGDLARSGVYRFVFPKEADGTVRQAPHCYVGEAGEVGKRICDYFVDRGVRMIRSAEGRLKDYGGAPVRGEIRNSRGEFTIQLLEIEGCLDVCGVKLNATRFADSFARVFLESWAILHAIQVEKYHVLNCSVDEGIRYLQRMGRASEVRGR